MNNDNIKGIECKFVMHLPKVEGYREDTHVVKEVIHHKDGTLEDNLRVISNYQRPFWVTKEPYRNHEDKKEAEEISKVNQYRSTQSDLVTEISKRLGNYYVGNKDMRKVKASPYVYGIDVDSKTYLKHLYQKKYPDLISENKVATFDIETDTINDEIIVISLSMKDKIYTVINKNMLMRTITKKSDPREIKKEYEKKLKYLYDKHIPRTLKVTISGDVEKEMLKLGTVVGSGSKLEGSVTEASYDKKENLTTLKVIVHGNNNYVITEKIGGHPIVSTKITGITNNMEVIYDVVDDEMDCIVSVMDVAHKWKPDFIAIWNISYDIPKMLEVCEKYGVKPRDIFSDPELPDNLKYFRWKEGTKSKMTESGKFKPINGEEQWHVVQCPASFYWIDAMSTHRFIRVGGKMVPGGYGLDNILKQELGERLGKLKFEDEKTNSLKGLEWHMYMVANKPLEYTIYNQWDNISMLYLDEKTKDLSHVISMLSGVSAYDIFNSGPKKIVDALHFFYLENDRVLGTKPPIVEDSSLLGLGEWIVLLPSNRIKDLGTELIPGSGIRTNARKYTSDSDQVSGYPSNTMAANVSKDTTIKEIKSIGDIPLSEFRLQNINLLFGPVNSLEYSQTMFKLPSIYEIKEELDNMDDLELLAA